MIEDAYLYLILIGVTIGVVLLALRQQARDVSRINLALIRLNEQHQYDTPLFLREVWPLLAQAGMRGITWRLDWFGMPLSDTQGQAHGNSITREITVADLQLTLTLYLPHKRGEQRYFNETLIETLLLLLRTDMLIKANSTDATFAQMSKLTLFLQHDMKNIAQFIQLMADQLATIPAGKEQQVLDHLRVTTPLIRHRADRIVRTLTVGTPQQEPQRTLQLHEELSQLCRLYRLDYAISGTAAVQAADNTLDSALDNILKNYSDMHLRDSQIQPLVSITIADQPEQVAITIDAANTPAASHLERLFEPFWSSDPAGLGIGLYQAKQLLQSCGGTLDIGQTDTGQLQFHITFPRTAA